MAKYRSKEIVEAFKWEGFEHMESYPKWFVALLGSGEAWFRGTDKLTHRLYISSGCNSYVVGIGNYITYDGEELDCFNSELFEQEFEEVNET